MNVISGKTNNKLFNNNFSCHEIKEYFELENELKKYIRNKKELKTIEEAFMFSQKMHDGQIRKNDDPYIIHPLTAAYFLAQWRMGPKTIIAGLLHDILEDTPVSKEEFVNRFGNEVADLVESVTKVSFFAKEKRQELKSEYLRKLYLSMSKDIRVIIIKIADRLHNMLTIKNISLEKQQIIAKETLEIYTAIAHRLGMQGAKRQLEDMSFQILNPSGYEEIRKLIEKDAEKRTKIIAEKIDEITVFLKKEKNTKIINIYGRTKTIYSTYRKMYVIGKTFDDITDLLAIRVISKSINDCYKILGLLHSKYIPLRNKFKDYIAIPKNCVYQSLHTTLSDHSGNIFEVQIRTMEMDHVAESGAAAHWRYKEKDKLSIEHRQKEIDEQVNIFNQIIDMDQQSAQTHDGETKTETIEDKIKNDFLSPTTYVLTPAGAMVTLPFGSTVLDFAYRIHTEIGEKTMGAKIDGVFVPLNTILKSGQIIEVKTGPKQHPNAEWLKIAVTANAKSNIRKYLNHQLNQEAIKDKKDEIKAQTIKTLKTINSYINQKDLRWKKRSESEMISIVKEMGFKDLNDFLWSVSRGDFTIVDAANKVFIDNSFTKDDEVLMNIKSKTIEDTNIKTDIVIEGITNIKTSIANCCMPVPVEQCVGFVSKGSGIKVHLVDCPNIMNLTTEEKKRLVSVAWNIANIKNKTYSTKLKIYAYDRPNLVYDISRILNGLKAIIVNLKILTQDKTMLVSGEITIKVTDSNNLSQIINSIRTIPGIIDLERGTKVRSNKI